ncbi:Uncharacterised protein [Chlamydia trachomatis]|nr:Uncharacterised protein [Chlamydia trachomatis]
MVEGKPVTASKTFTPQESDGCENVDFTIDASMLAGKTTVVFERLEHDGQTIAVHTDINDEDQTVLFEKTPTPPEEHLAKTGAQTLSFLAGVALFALMGVGAIVLHRRS